MPKTYQQKKQRRQQRKRKRSLANVPTSFSFACDVEPLDIQALADGDSETLPKFSMVAYSGGVMNPFGFGAPVVVDLAGMKIPNQKRPILLQHDSRDRIGHSEKIENNGRRLTATGIVSGTGEAAQTVTADAKNGFPWQASIGASIVGSASFIDEGETVEANGRKFKGPLIMVRKSVLGEISFVALGADGNTSAKIAAQAASNTTEVVDMTFEKWLEAKGFDIDELSDGQRSTLQAAFDAEQSATQDPPADPPSDPPADPVDTQAVIAERRRAIAAEQSRVDSITAICAEFDGPQITVNENQVSLSAHAIREGWDVDRTRTQAELQQLRASRPQGPAIHSRSHESSCTLQAMQGAMVLRAGNTLDNPHYRTAQAIAIGIPSWMQRDINDDTRQQIMEAAHAFSDMSMLDVCREACRIDGSNPGSGRSSIIQAAMSGATLATVFTTNVNARVLATYMEAGDFTQGWVAETDVADFKSNDRFRMVKGPALAKLPRGKTAEHATRSDVNESYSIARYAKQFVVDEQDVIDDSFNALSDVPREMGLAAARLRPDLIASIMLANAVLGADSVALFDNATHGNLDTGSALAAATMKIGISAVETQQENSVNLELNVTHLIVPSTLRFTAHQLLNSAVTNADTADGNINPLAGENIALRSTSRLENGVTDPRDGTVHTGANNDWYLAAANGHTMEVGYLRGTGRAPQVRSFTLSEGQWGLGWDVNMDIGAIPLDFRALYKGEG